MSKYKLAFDADGVLIDSVYATLFAFQQLFGDNITWEDIVQSARIPSAKSHKFAHWSAQHSQRFKKIDGKNLPRFVLPPRNGCTCEKISLTYESS